MPLQRLIACLLVGTCALAAGEAKPPTFADDVAPIVNRQCIVCHRAGGAAPFSLESFELVQKRARQIAEVTADRYMPPWKPESGYGPNLKEERRLTAEDIAVLARWHAGGAPPGNLANVLKPPVFGDGWQLGPPDLILGLDTAYEFEATVGDVYRNFVMRVPLDRPRFVRAVEFRPQSTSAIHHAALLLDTTGWARQRDAEDETPGFGSMNLSHISSPQGQFIGWAPGSGAHEAHPGTQWRLDPGTDLVAQLHLVSTGRREVVAPGIALYFTDEPPTRISTTLVLSSRRIDIPAGAAGHTIRESFALPVPARLVGLFPHAHYLGKDLRLFSVGKDGVRQGLFRIPDWDFNWQRDYTFETPVELPAGTTIVMEYSYDNSAQNPRNPSNPPRRVQLGWNSTDEMGEMVLRLHLDNPGDLVRLAQARSEYEIAQAGGEAPYFHSLGTDLEQAGLTDKAETMYRRSLQAEPQQPEVLASLGGVLEKQGQHEEAERMYRAAIAIDSSSVGARMNLARFAYRRGGDATSALRLTGEILAADPGQFQASLLQAQILLGQGSGAAAISLLQTCLDKHPDESYLWLQIGRAHLARGDSEKAGPFLQRAAGNEPANELSRHYATMREIRGAACYGLAIIAQQRDDVDAFRSSLQATLRMTPNHAEALLYSAALAFLESDGDAAQPFLTGLLSLPAELRPPPGSILEVLPFPEGPERAIAILAGSSQTAAAHELLDTAVRMARSQNRSDWIERLRRAAAAHGLE